MKTWRQVSNPALNELLVQMVGFISREDRPVFVMAATNRGNEIDFALQRRFDRIFEMGCLDKEGRRWMLKKNIGKQGGRTGIPVWPDTWCTRRPGAGHGHRHGHGVQVWHV